MIGTACGTNTDMLWKTYISPTIFGEGIHPFGNTLLGADTAGITIIGREEEIVRLLCINCTIICRKYRQSSVCHIRRERLCIVCKSQYTKGYQKNRYDISEQILHLPIIYNAKIKWFNFITKFHPLRYG